MGTRKTRTPAPAPSPIESVKQLMTERAKYEQWLEELEAKKGSTPPKVFDRVQQDYLGRLQGVMEQLKQHTAALQEHSASLNKKLVELASAEESRLEEISEAELRAKVGEMTPAEWDSVSKKADRELAKLKQDQELIETDLSNLEDILGEITGEKPPAKRDSGAQTKRQNVDELEFLKSVVGTGPRPAATPTSPAPAQPATSATGPSQPSPATPPSTPVQPSAPAASATASEPAAAPPGAKPTPGNIPVVQDQPKTLKCQECGAMNYPSEWYCERCGAELTVV